MNRRQLFTSALALPLVWSRGSEAWPHTSVGRRAEWVMGPDSQWRMKDYWAYPVLAGAIFEGGRIVDPGRSYTYEEWARVEPEVTAFLAKRNCGLFGKVNR